MRDSVGVVSKAPTETRSDVEAWIVALGITTDAGKPDWRRIAKEADLELSADAVYQVPSRWGKNPRQMAKVVAWLEQQEGKRKQPTEHGQAKKRLEEWEALGKDLAQVPQLLDREIERLRPLALDARKIADGERARASAFGAITEKPKKSRK